MKRNANAVWNGSIKEGKGHLSTQSNTLNQTPYSFSSRFEQGTGTNPEELIAAAHAGCFSMKLSLSLTQAGFIPDEIQTSCQITIEDLNITKSELTCTAKVPGLDAARFQEFAQDAKANCPVSKALKALDISLTATLA
ncbi:MAG: OsmC family protein [Bacteroidetes bacterium]|nr:OsmC family protein [Bacteroidota bacterium]MBS1630235.1 OsmC family protein [Bacteroidota bacterium]